MRLEIARVPSLASSVALDDIQNDDFAAFIDHWLAIRGDRIAPAWADFELMALPAKLIPYVVVVDVNTDPLDFVYRFYGTGQTRRKKVDWTGKSLKSFPVERGVKAFDEYAWIVANKRPQAIRDQVILDGHLKGPIPFEQRAVRLPLSNDGETVSQIVSLALWDEK
jgi:hypothetical protein